MPVSYDSQLHRQVHQRMDEGRLSSAAPGHTLAGPGADCPCAVCDEVIRAHELEYEIQTDGGKAQHFHIACYTAWFMECPVATD